MTAPVENITLAGQMAVVNKMVLPLLDKMNISVTVTTQPKGMRLDLQFDEAPNKTGAPLIGTDTPAEAAQLWALRAKIQAEKAKHGLDDA